MTARLVKLCFVPWLLLLGGSPRAACPEPPETDQGDRRGLTRRDFEKALRHELDLLGGVYFSELYGAAPIAGVAYSFHVNEDLALEVSFAWAPLASALSRAVEHQTGTDVLAPRDALLYGGNFVWHPAHGKFMLFQSFIPHFDFYLSAGLGVTDDRSTTSLTYAVAGGIKIFLTRFFSLRIEVGDRIHTEEILGETLLANNLTVTAGVGLWLPAGAPE